LHKSFSPLFNPATPEDYKPVVKGRISERLVWVDQQLESKPYLLGEQFSAADAYLFTVTNWTRFVGIDISGLARLGAFMGRVAARPAVQAALKAEGLLP
jgi:glutathione S-transferase